MTSLRERLGTLSENADRALHKRNQFTQVLERLEQGTGVRRLVIVKALTALFCLYLMVGYGAQILCNLIGFVYPAYMSLKAAVSQRREDFSQLLTYWPIYSILAILEMMFFVITTWIPFYWFFKCCFLVWCCASVPWNGALFIQRVFVRPFLDKHQENIDAALDKGKIEMVDLAKEVAARAMNSIRDDDSQSQSVPSWSD